MSFIGPRPLMVRYIPRYTAEQRRRHSVLPGISGWAQVNGRTDLSWSDRLTLDVWYVDHQSLWLDLRILWRTFRASAEGSGYSQSGSDTGPEFLGTGLPPGICPVTELPLAPTAAATAGKSALEEFMRLSPEVEGLLPGEEDVAFYEEHGSYVTPKVLPDDVIDAAIRGAERHWAGERDWRLPVSSGFGDWKPGDGDTIRNSEYTALQNREIRALVQHPIIGAIAGRLTRSSEIRLWDDQLVSKPPSAARAGPSSAGTPTAPTG